MGAPAPNAEGAFPANSGSSNANPLLESFQTTPPHPTRRLLSVLSVDAVVLDPGCSLEQFASELPCLCGSQVRVPLNV